MQLIHLHCTGLGWSCCSINNRLQETKQRSLSSVNIIANFTFRWNKQLATKNKERISIAKMPKPINDSCRVTTALRLTNINYYEAVLQNGILPCLLKFPVWMVLFWPHKDWHLVNESTISMQGYILNWGDRILNSITFTAVKGLYVWTPPYIKTHTYTPRPKYLHAWVKLSNGKNLLNMYPPSASSYIH